MGHLKKSNKEEDSCLPFPISPPFKPIGMEKPQGWGFSGDLDVIDLAQVWENKKEAGRMRVFYSRITALLPMGGGKFQGRILNTLAQACGLTS